MLSTTLTTWFACELLFYLKTLLSLLTKQSLLAALWASAQMYTSKERNILIQSVTDGTASNGLLPSGGQMRTVPPSPYWPKCKLLCKSAVTHSASWSLPSSSLSLHLTTTDNSISKHTHKPFYPILHSLKTLFLKDQIRTGHYSSFDCSLSSSTVQQSIWSSLFLVFLFSIHYLLLSSFVISLSIFYCLWRKRHFLMAADATALWVNQLCTLQSDIRLNFESGWPICTFDYPKDCWIASLREARRNLGKSRFAYSVFFTAANLLFVVHSGSPFYHCINLNCSIPVVIVSATLKRVSCYLDTGK